MAHAHERQRDAESDRDHGRPATSEKVTGSAFEERRAQVSAAVEAGDVPPMIPFIKRTYWTGSGSSSP